MTHRDPVRFKPVRLTNLHSWLLRTVLFDRSTRRRLGFEPRLRLWPPSVPNLRNAVFVVGAPRSGTTFLGQSLASLPEVSYHFEPVATKAACRSVYNRDWGFRRSRFFYQTIYRSLMYLSGTPHLRFAEKTPQNCFIMSFLARAFSDAAFVHIVRDGRDAALSLSKRPWLAAKSPSRGQRESGGHLHGPYARFWVEPDRAAEFESTTDMHRCIWSWRRHTEAALSQASSTLGPSRYLEVRFEQLIRCPTRVAERIADFLSIARATSRDRLRRALSQARPAVAGRWHAELDTGTLAQIEKEAGPLLQRLGYLH